MTPITRIAATLAFLFVLAVIEVIAEHALIGRGLTGWEWVVPYVQGIFAMAFLERVWA